MTYFYLLSPLFRCQLLSNPLKVGEVVIFGGKYLSTKYLGLKALVKERNKDLFKPWDGVKK